MAPSTFKPRTWGHGWFSSFPAQTPCAFWEETVARVTSQGGGAAQSLCGASSSTSAASSARDGQRERGHAYRRGLETCELNLVNSPGAVHSVPSCGKEGGVCQSSGDTTGQTPPGCGDLPSTSIRHDAMLPKGSSGRTIALELCPRACLSPAGGTPATRICHRPTTPSSQKCMDAVTEHRVSSYRS